jgi:hypothetical protein
VLAHIVRVGQSAAHEHVLELAGLPTNRYRLVEVEVHRSEYAR